ncbi:MAG: leucyl aminopeptidase family protein [Alphaproteobacteria bacterium]|nr:leucyl aminopeptidase family protein [Alphaproteobacteria bacterium]
MHSAFAPASSVSIPLELVTAGEFDGWIGTQDERTRDYLKSMGFKADIGRWAFVPSTDAGPGRVCAGAGDGKDPFLMATLPGLLPEGDYRLERCPPDQDPVVLALGWADGAYRFTRYRRRTDAQPRLVLPLPGLTTERDLADMLRQAEAIDHLRDLINTPPCDMGPSEIERECRQAAAEFGASIEVSSGPDLEAGYPMVHAVGKGAEQAPRYIEMTWGRKDAPVLALVGKGVAFDTGGLNIKTSGMGLMKKDMGGAAHALALARLVMGASLDVRLVLAIPTVENAIGSRAFRPSDVLRSRKGLTVEVEDTDAEGRLILGDALARVCELKPDLLIDFATLTGAARVALGPDLAPLYTDDESLAEEILSASKSVGDPVWRMPLWAGYEAGLRSHVADMKNLGDGPMGGSITGALFLKRFVDTSRWAHFDIWGWRPARYGRPPGAAACGLRAVWSVLRKRYGG